jgi:hypothetical protein
VGEDEVDNAEGTAHLCAIGAMFASVLIVLTLCFVWTRVGLRESLVRMFAGFDAGCLILLVRAACLLRYSRLRSDVLLLVYRVLLQPPWDPCSVVHGLYLRTGRR